MIKVNKLTDYSISILHHFMHMDTILNASELAEAIALPAPTVSKILKILQKNKLLHSHRGAQGGYQLAKPLPQISVAEVILAMEGRLAVTECSVKIGACTHEHSCMVRSPWQRINQKVMTMLSGISLTDMMNLPEM